MTNVDNRSSTSIEDNEKIAVQALLEPAELELAQVAELIGTAAGQNTGADTADLYFQSSRSEQWFIEDGIVRHSGYSADGGVGVRAVSGECTGFAYTADYRMPSLSEAVSRVRSAVRSATPARVEMPGSPDPVAPLYGNADPLDSMSCEEKVTRLKELDARARRADPRVREVVVSCASSWSTVLIVDAHGRHATDVRPLVRLMVRVLAVSGERREEGFSGGGRRQSLHSVFSNGVAEAFVDDAVASALLNLESVPMKAGTMPVVLGPGWPGVLLHEAIGHGMEGDFNRKNLSVFSGQLGQQVSSPTCTIVDDATLCDRRGSISVDDEGVPGQRTVLVEDGVLKGYLQDRHNAALSGKALTGNGRRQSWRYPPMPRMTNTFMLPGQYAPEEVIASVDHGLYVGNMSGGQVDITNGKFVFSTSQAWLIEKGRCTVPVKDCTLIGDGHEVLARMSMLGNDMRIDEGLGMCGKNGQSVPVGVGQPTVRVDSMVVGGAA